MITPDELYCLYINDKKSVAQISRLLNCSQNKINYWLEKYEIPKRSISEAIYYLKNPNGDPFSLTRPNTLEEGILFGMGIALYWGEGTKRGNGGLRLSNSDPRLVRKFIEFLEKFLNIDKKRLKFSILIPPDVSLVKVINYWSRELNFSKDHFYRPQVVVVRGRGTYKYKTKYGTVILNFNNKRLKELICNLIENIQ